jgi:hypothetical protein
MKIDLTKILTISFRDYAECKGKKLSDYEPIGVHSDKYSNLSQFALEAPENAEVIVDYHLVHHNLNYHYGTALIPKKRKVKRSKRS